MRVGTVGIFVFALVLVFAMGAPAAVYTWNWDANGYWDNSGGQGNWNTGVGGAFPNAIDDVANVDGQTMTIDLDGQTVTLGTMNLSTSMWYCPLSNLQNGTLNFQVSSGSAVINQQNDPWRLPWVNSDLISANVQLSSPLIYSAQEFGQSGLGNGSTNGLQISGVISGNNGITKTGPGTLYLTNASNSFTGDLRVQDGILNVGNWAAQGNPANNITLGGVGTIGRLYITDTSAITRSFVLSGEGGEFFVAAWTGPGWPNSGNTGAASFNNIISGTGNLFIGMGYASTFGGTFDNTYVGDTKVLGWANVLTTARVLKGNVAIEAGGIANLLNSNNLDPGASVYVGSFQMGSAVTSTYGALTVMGDFLPTIDPRSSGVLSLSPNQNGAWGSTGPIINAALAAGAPQLGNGMMSIGISQAPGVNMAEVFTGASLQPNIDHVFRFYVNNANFTLDAPGSTGVLTDVGGVATSVQFSGPPNVWGMTWMSTNDANDFTGTLTVNPAAAFAGNMQGTGSPFGASSGNVYLNGGALDLSSGITSPAMVTKNDLSLQGQTALFFWTANHDCPTKMTLTDIVRNNNAVMGIASNWGGTQGVLGTNVFLYATTPPVNGNGETMAPAYFVRYGGEGFLKYDATNGFMDATFTATDGFGANNGTDIVNLTGATAVPAGTNVYAVRANGAMTGGDITIGSGGLILTGRASSNNTIKHTTNINFGQAEGVVYSSGTWNELAGTITGSNGLTFGANFNGNPGTYIYVSGDSSATLHGTITINMGIVKINNAGSLGDPTNRIVLNGGSGNNGNCAVGALSPSPTPILDGTDNYGSVITLANPITVGPNGGTLMMEYWQGKFDLTGPITGPGTLTVAGHPGNWVRIDSAGNDWAGGTFLDGSPLYVSAGAKLGHGPVTITSSSTLVLEGATNTDASNNINIYASWGYTDSPLLAIAPATATIGTLSGNGRVMLDYDGWQSNTTLTFGNGGSSDFYGIIQDTVQGRTGSLIYAGTGTFTLWGEGVYGGSTTINAGTFAVNGKIVGSGVTVNSGGTLAGTGLVTAPVVVAGGTLGGSLTVNNSVTLNSGAINAGGTINGLLAVNAGTVAGTTAVNGNVTIAGAATVTGTHAISGNVALTNGSFTAGVGTTIGSLDVGAAGAFAGASTIAGAVTNAGAIDGAHMIAGNYMQNGGSFSGMSTFGTALTPVAVTVNGGSFSGNHTIYGTFATTAGSKVVLATHNDATAGTLTVVGNASLDHSTVLNFNLGPAGTTGGNVNDYISITGNLSLDGTLNVTNLSGFATGTYVLIDYTGALTGAGLTLGTTPTGYSYTLVTTIPNEIELAVTPFSVPGDTNGDTAVNSLDIDAIYRHLTVLPPGFTGWGGVGGMQPWPWAQSAYQAQYDVNNDLTVSQGDVTYELRTFFLTSYGDADLSRATDFQDFQALLDHWQNSGAAIGWAQADFNGDGVVDFLDFQNLLDYWNPSGWNFAPTQTPEPASLSLILLGGLALLRRKK